MTSIAPRLLIGGLALALATVGCTKSEAPSPPSPAAQSSNTAAGSTPPATKAPGTTVKPKKDDSTDTTPNGGTKLGTWKATNDSAKEFTGKVTCAVPVQQLEMDFTIDNTSGTFTFRFRTLDGPGEFKGINPDGSVGAKGTVDLKSKNFDTTVGGSPAKAMNFSFNVASKTVKSEKESSLIGEGSCVVDTPGRGTGAEGNGGTLAVPVTDAAAFVQQLFDVAGGSLDPKKDGFAAPDAWVKAGLPKSALQGSALAATPTKISGFASQDDKNDKFNLYPFAVTDAKGTCVFGLIYTTPKEKAPLTKLVKPDGGKCTGDAARDYFEAKVVGS